MMRNSAIQKCVYVLSMGLLVTLFAACSDPTSSSGATATPAATATSAATSNKSVTPTPTVATTQNQPAIPTPTVAAKAKGATTQNQPATPTPVADTGTDFQSFTGVDFTILYPAKWQKVHKTSTGGVSGAANQYRFVAQDNITGFYIMRRTQEQVVGGMFDYLIGRGFRCDMVDNGAGEGMTIGGMEFGRVDLTCTAAGSNKYEVHELVHNSNDKPYGPTVIMYCAVASDFAHTKAAVFDPMLASFKFN